MTLKHSVIRSKKFNKAEKLIITLHGYGTCGADFAEVGELLLKNEIDNAIFIFPDAPEKCGAGFGGFQWFDLKELNYEGLRQGLEKTGPILKEFIVTKIEEFDCDNVYLIGFSQGSIMALEMIYHLKISKILAYSGLFALSLEKQPLSKPETLIVHSDDDPVVPYINATRSQENLVSLGIDAKLKTGHNIGHSISVEGWNCGTKFLNSEKKTR